MNCVYIFWYSWTKWIVSVKSAYLAYVPVPTTVQTCLKSCEKTNKNTGICFLFLKVYYTTACPYRASGAHWPSKECHVLPYIFEALWKSPVLLLSEHIFHTAFFTCSCKNLTGAGMQTLLKLWWHERGLCVGKHLSAGGKHVSRSVKWKRQLNLKVRSVTSVAMDLSSVCGRWDSFNALPHSHLYCRKEMLTNHFQR